MAAVLRDRVLVGQAGAPLRSAGYGVASGPPPLASNYALGLPPVLECLSRELRFSGVG